MSKVGLIVTGGTIEESFAKEQLAEICPDVIIGVDGGLEFLYRNRIKPDYVLGDFDSVSPEVAEYYLQGESTFHVRRFHPVKDASDTELAVKTAVELGVDRLWILGGTGTRLDHVWANVQVLKIALDAGIQAVIADSHNRISLHNQEIRLKKDEAYGRYFSVFPLGEKIEHFNIEGAKYPLCNHTLSPYDSLCVSNEIAGGEARISFPEGIVVLMETRD